MTTHSEAALEWFGSWNRMDRAAFLALLSPDFVARGVMAPGGVDKDTIWNVMVAFRGTFPDQRWDLGDWLVSDHDLLVCEVIESGTFAGMWPDPEREIAPTNRSYVSSAVMLFRFDSDGLIVENRTWYDSVDWFHQIGVDPNVGAPPQEVPDVAITRVARSS